MGAGGVTVFNGIEMQIIEMVGVVALIAQGVFDKAALPDAAPTVAETRGRAGLFDAVSSEPVVCEVFFDEAEAFGIIGVIRWEGDDGVKMIGHQGDGIEDERMLMLTVTDCGTETGAGQIGTEDRGAAFSDHSEEKRPARQITTAIVRHWPPIPSSEKP